MSDKDITWDYVSDVSDKASGTAHHIKLSEAVELEPLISGETEEHEYFIVSTAYVLGTPETYVFPATSDGEVESWGEVISEDCSVLVSQKNTTDWEMVADRLTEAANTVGLQA